MPKGFEGGFTSFTARLEKLYSQITPVKKERTHQGPMRAKKFILSPPKDQLLHFGTTEFKN
ncbi:hypothetical protein HYC85_017511 [Camellia sinensis]|uniref:Uncharacterized protein n=1 Tax=Camellia sinensis TaxID=4442 RepID=A0A7J7GVG4_CAMSI|nr:hypothetical protein HYC85_017511 [Camellia sinensis]